MHLSASSSSLVLFLCCFSAWRTPQNDMAVCSFGTSAIAVSLTLSCAGVGIVSSLVYNSGCS